MPIYAFVCNSCEHGFEELVPMGQLAPCPKCGSKGVRKQLTAPAAYNGDGSSGLQCPMKGQCCADQPQCPGGMCGL